VALTGGGGVSEGFRIPISGDITPLEEALAGLRGAIADLNAHMTAGLAGAEAAGAGVEAQMGKVAGAVRRAGAAQSAARRQEAGMGSGLGAAVMQAGKYGEAVFYAVNGLRTAGQLAGKLRGGRDAAKGMRDAGEAAEDLAEGMEAAGEETQQTGRRGRDMKRLALTVAGVTAALGGAYVAYRSLRGGARMAGRVGRAALRGIAGAARVAQRSVGGIFRAVQGLVPGLNVLNRLRGMVPFAGFIGGAGAVAVLVTEVRKALREAERFEDVRVGVEQFAGGTEAARRLFEQLEAIESKTPFEGADLQAAMGKMLFAGIREDVVGLVRELGAVARDGETLKDLADAMAKGFARTRFQTEEMNKFLERGINLMPALERVTGQSGEGLRKTIQEGLSFDEVRRAIRMLSAEGGAFFGMLERRSRTTRGLLSTLSSVIGMLRRDLATPINDAIKPILASAIELVGKLRERAAEIGRRVGEAILTVYAAIRSGGGLEMLRLGLRLAMLGAVEVWRRGTRAVVAFLGAALPQVFEAAVQKLRDPGFWSGVMNMFRALGNIISAGIANAMGKTGAATDFAAAAQAHATAAQMQMAAAGGGTDVAEVLADAMVQGAEAAAAAVRGPASAGLQDALADWRLAREVLAGEVRQLKEGAAVPEAPGAAPAPAGGRDAGPERPAGPSRGVTSIVSSLARVGGGGFGVLLMQPMLAESRKQTGLQRKMVRLLEGGRGGAAPEAVYA